MFKTVFGSHKVRLGLAVVCLYVLVALLAPVLAPHDPLEVNVINKFAAPSREYPFGTDELGRCVLSRLIWGSRISLSYSAMVLAIMVVIGVSIGLLAGYAGGRIDNFIMRVIDVFMAMPSMIVVLAIAGTLGASGRNMILSMSLVYWAEYARITRALTLSAKNRTYIMALKAGGCRLPSILFRHILKNISPSIISLATMEIGSIILAIAGLSLRNWRAFSRPCPRRWDL